MKAAAVTWPLAVLCLIIQSIHEANSIGPLVIFEVLVGAIEIYNFVKPSEQNLEGRTKHSTLQLDWKLESSIESVEEIVRGIPEAMQFSHTLHDMRKSFETIYKHHTEILIQKDLLQSEGEMTQVLLEDYKRQATSKLTFYDNHNPLHDIHVIVRDIFRNYSSHQHSFLENYQNFADVCTTHLSSLQTGLKLFEHILWSSQLYYETVLVSLLMENRTLNGTDTLQTRGLCDKPSHSRCVYDLFPKLGNIPWVIRKFRCGIYPRICDYHRLAKKYAMDIATWFNVTSNMIMPDWTNMSRRLYTCGPGTSNGDTGIELRVFSKYFTRACNEYDEPDKLKCAGVGDMGCSARGEFKYGYCNISRACQGRLSGCKTLDDPNAEVCIKNSSEDQRYQYYETSSTQSSGNNENGCTITSLKKESKRTFINYPEIPGGFRFIGEVCTTCDCTCEEGNYSINLAPVYSDISNNMVVTGAKFVLKDNVLEVHIQQGKLLKNGAIANDTQWIGPEAQTLQKISRDVADKILLSTTMLPPNRVLTGLQLDYGTSNDFKTQNSFILLRIFSSECDVKDGRLVDDEHIIEDLPFTFSQTEFSLHNLPSPRVADGRKEEFSISGVWITLSTSNGEDGGQSTIPLFDGQEVTPRILTPLSGAGLYYKGGKRWAGYIGVELHTYDFYKLISTDSAKNSPGSLKDLTALFMKVKRHHDSIIKWENDAEKILGDLVNGRVLQNMHQNFRDIFGNYKSYQENWSRKFQDDMCTSHVSPLQLVDTLVTGLKLSSQQFYHTIMVSIQILRNSNSKDDGGSSLKNLERYVSESYNKTIMTIKPTLSNISRKLYVCDLPNAADRDHMIELKLFSKSFTRICNAINYPNKLECAAISESEECSGTEVNTVCSISQSCKGKLKGCEPLRHSNATVCISDFPSDQRYEYYTMFSTSVESNDYNECHVQSLKETKLCSSCDCTCEDGEYFINLAPAYSNVPNNMVVTGAKFVLRQNILEIHVQQAQLLPNGQINKTASWIGPQWEALQNVTWDEARRFLLSTIIIPPERVLTGLKLDYGTANDFKDRYSYVFLRIYSNEYNYKTGHIANVKPQIEGLRNSFPQKELVVQGFTSPKKIDKYGAELPENDAWVTLGTSNGKDGGKSTIPFFDGREVTSHRIAPLSGAGLYYKGGKDWAGYIGIELHTYDTSRFITGDLYAE